LIFKNRIILRKFGQNYCSHLTANNLPGAAPAWDYRIIITVMALVVCAKQHSVSTRLTRDGNSTLPGGTYG